MNHERPFERPSEGMYSSLIKPVLFRLPAESAHRLALGGLRLVHAIPGVRQGLRATLGRLIGYLMPEKAAA